MASAKVILFTSKTLKNGMHPIMLRIIHERKMKYFNLNASCGADMWDEKNGLPKRKHPNFHEISVLIDVKRLQAQRLILELESTSKGYTLETISTRLTTDKTKLPTTTLFEYFDQTIERLRKAERLGYAAVFISTKNYLKRFCNGKDLPFSGIDFAFVNRFDTFLEESGLKPNAAFVPIRTFKTLLNYAIKEGLTTPDFAPFKAFSFSKFRRDKPLKRAIQRDDIRKLENLELEPNTLLFHARNYFVFIYYSAGINFIDLAHLRPENTTGNRLTYIRRKTKESISIGLLAPALTILETYRKDYPNPAGYIFPILNDKHQTAQSRENRIDKVLKQVNGALKELAEMTGISAKLTTYVARHSFATNMRDLGAPTSVISQALGHESERTTRLYLDSLPNSVMDEAMKAIL